MKIAEINSCDYGSTGRIMFEIAKYARAQGTEVITFSAQSDRVKVLPQFHCYIGSLFENRIHRKLSYYTGFSECFSVFGTHNLINKSKDYKPDIIHIHNLHTNYICVPMLFHYIKKNNIRVIWTLHDCWPITGHCPHFTVAKCQKWKTGCFNCTLYRKYPASCFDNSKTMYHIKKHVLQM